MRRAFGYAGAWLLATSIAVTVAWFGCAVVLNKASPPAPEVLSSVHPRSAALPEALPGVTLLDGATGSNRPPSVPTRTSQPRASRSGRPTPTVSISAPTIIRHSAPPARTLPPQPPASAGPSRTQPASPDPTATAGTFELAGGRATVSFAPDRVQ